MPETLKFAWIVLCFAVALGSYPFCRYRRDWAWLAGGMAFTVGADFFLVLYDAHVPGVAVFCFAHICYALRCFTVKLRYVWGIFAAVFVLVMIFAVNAWVLALAGLYAALFGVSLAVNFAARRSGWPVLAGLALFALCDICVAVYNIPRYFGVAVGFDVFPLIWIFYLPAQALLAVSAIHFRSVKHGQPFA